MLTCQGQVEPRPPDAQAWAPSHHHSPCGLYSAPSLGSFRMCPDGEQDSRDGSIDTTQR